MRNSFPVDGCMPSLKVGVFPLDISSWERWRLVRYWLVGSSGSEKNGRRILYRGVGTSNLRHQAKANAIAGTSCAVHFLLALDVPSSLHQEGDLEIEMVPTELDL
jgi:hypothetical protein